LGQNLVVMSTKDIIGRKEEKAILERASRSPDPEFVAIYGRRRVGKTHLVKEFFENAISFEIIGIHGASLHDQLDNFSRALGSAIGMGIRPQRPSSWSEAFHQLEQFLESSEQKERKGKRIVFFDELPWLNTPRSKFLSSLEHFWNSWGSRQKDFILLICGSAASWMLQNIVLAKGGLHNRLSRQIPLFPFTLRETRDFLLSRGVDLTPSQIIELYMTMGGVPYYLKEAEPGLSAAQIIDRSCFSSHGFLRDEFTKLYASLFEKADQHRKIVEMLARKRKGLTRNEILQLTGLQSGGSASRRIEDLEESGFIQSYIPFGKNANDALYRLADEYSLFYLDWIRGLGKRSPGKGYWLSKRNTPRQRTWAGYVFESVCLKHVPRLKAALGIAGVETTEAPWRYQSSQKSEIPGAQIDLLIDRRDDAINLCEMKFSETEFTINKKYAMELRQKMDVFRKVTGSRKNIFLTMVTTFGVTDNAYAQELVANSLTMEALF
jgi:AAA+ ATPase superfamily predicted ATPase